MTTNATECNNGIEPRRAYLDVDGARLSYLEWGEQGMPALLLHGITSSARAWWRVAPALVERGYHVFAVDMPGHGASDLVADHRIDAIAGIVGALARTPMLAGAVVIGHSWGGAVALALAAANGETLSRVALVDPALGMTPQWGADALPRYVEDVGLPPAVTLPALREANPDWHACDVYWKGEALQLCRPEAVRGFFTQSGAWDLTPLLAHVAAPLLLLTADLQYTVIPPATLAAATAALRPGRGTLITIPGANHNIIRGGFVAFMRVLDEWLDKTM